MESKPPDSDVTEVADTSHIPMSASQSNKHKRKPAKVTREMIAPIAVVTPIQIDDMVLHYKGAGKCYFKRLKYRGCPNVLAKPAGAFPANIPLTDMQRDDVVRELYYLMQANLTSITRTHFISVTHYFRWIDAQNRSIPDNDYWHKELTDDYVTDMIQQIERNELHTTNAFRRKSSIKWVLLAMGRHRQARALTVIEGVRKSTRPRSGLHVEYELRPIAKLLLKAYTELLKHFTAGTRPTIHPLYDAELVEIQIHKRNVKSPRRYVEAFTRALFKSHPHNHLVRVAMMLIFMFTGINTKPLSDMKISDVRFKQVRGGRYIFDTVKGRAGHGEQDNAMGFTQYARGFVEGWLKVALTMSNGDDSAPLFPYFTSDNQMKSYSVEVVPPQKGINKMLLKMGLPSITSSAFRKTKSDVLMRETEDVYLVSMSLNNTVQVTKNNYANGVESDHQKALNASMDATYNIVKGVGVDEAVHTAKFTATDIFDQYEYEQLRSNQDRSHEGLTPLGVRCQDNTKGAAKAIERAIHRTGIKTLDVENICTDFFGCYECSQHALVADVEGIWLTLSFKDTLHQLQQTPAINSMPKAEYTTLWQTLSHILELYKEKSAENYAKALEKNKTTPHPLYQTVLSINDLLEVF